MILSVLVFIIIFSIVVISHEMGHFLIARMNGIAVKEFAVGMGPVIYKKKKKETEWVIRLLPIGGACVFEGADIFVEDEEEKENPAEGDFRSANVWRRIATVLAGPVFNVILGFFLALILVGFTGTDRPVIQDLIPDYPAEEAGLIAGDLITEMDGENINLYREISINSYLNKGEDIEITYERDGVEYETVIQPKYDAETDRYYIGFIGSGEYVEATGLKVFSYAWYEVKYALSSTIKSLQMLVTGNANSEDVSGPVGITLIIDDVIETSSPYGISSVVLTLCNFALLLSVNLGVLNLLPIPALDGGRLILMLVEVVRGKPLEPEKEGVIQFVGFALIVLLMVFVLYNDITKLFT